MGLFAIAILAIINYVNPVFLLSMVATVLLAAAVDQRVANYRIT